MSDPKQDLERIEEIRAKRYRYGGEMHSTIMELCDLAERQAKEITVLRLKSRSVDRLPFCADHRDKVAGKPCRECEIERQARRLEEAEKLIEPLKRVAELQIHTHGPFWADMRPDERPAYSPFTKVELEADNAELRLDRDEHKRERENTVAICRYEVEQRDKWARAWKRAAKLWQDTWHDLDELCPDVRLAALEAENAALKADLQQSRLAFSGALMEMPIKCEHCDDTGVVEVQYDSGTDAPPHLRDEPCPSCERGELTALRRVRDVAKVFDRKAYGVGAGEAFDALRAVLDKLEAPK